MKRLFLLLLLLFGCVFGAAFLLAVPASAHAALVTSDPADGARLRAAPHTVTLTFDESVGIGGIGYLHVIDQAGKQVDARAAYHPDGDDTKVADDLKHGLGKGSYTASYRVISADSHPVAGSIAFVVGHGRLVRGSGIPSGSTVNPLTADAFDVARWISFSGLALLGGGWLVLTIWPAGRDEPRARRLLWGGWAALGAGSLLELVVQGPYTAGAGLGSIGSGALLHDTLLTEYGQLHVTRLVLLAVLAAFLARALHSAARDARPDAVTGAAFGVAVVWTFSQGGHAGTTPPTSLSVPIDMAHLLAMATWIGGLLMLAVAVLPRGEPDELRAVLPVFSDVAFISVTVLVASGTYSAWRGIGTVHAIFATTYGLIVVGKILLLVGILTVANESRKLVRRRAVAYAMTDVALATAPEPGPGEDPIANERLRRAVWVEALVALVVLGFSAVLVAEPRGKEALVASYSSPVSATAPLDGGDALDVTATPGMHGPVTITIRVTGASRPKSITATATQKDRRIGPLPVKLAKEGGGQYGGTVTLPVAGSWELDFVVTTSTFVATSTDTTIHLH